MKTLMASCLVGGLLLMGCSESMVIEAPVARVETFTLPYSNNQVIREFNALARAQDLTPLSFRVDGRISSIPVIKGQRVKKGDLLAALDKQDYEIVLNDRTARMEVARKQAQRTKLLVDKQLISQSEYDQIKAQYLVSLAEAKQAKLYLDYTELRAPFDGVVSDIFVESFENVRPGSEIVTMHKVERIDVEVQIPDILLAVSKRNDVKAMQQVYDVTFDAFPEVIFKGTILEINTEKDPSSYTFIATLAVPLDGKYKILEGMPAKVKANLSHLTYTYTRQHLVPIEAVLMRDGSQINEQEGGVWLYQADSDSVKYQQVKLGVIVGDMIEVVSGLSGGQIIITGGAKRLVDGQRVELIKG